MWLSFAYMMYEQILLTMNLSNQESQDSFSHPKRHTENAFTHNLTIIELPRDIIRNLSKAQLQINSSKTLSTLASVSTYIKANYS